MEAGERPEVTGARGALGRLEGPQPSVCRARPPALGAAQPGTGAMVPRGMGSGPVLTCRSSWACGAVGLLFHGLQAVEAGRNVASCPAGTLGFVSRLRLGL